MNHHHSKVYVEYRLGGKAINKKVTLGFNWGVTSPAFTDRYGVAIIQHESVGRAKVFVNGYKVGEFNAPGETVVFLENH